MLQFLQALGIPLTGIVINEDNKAAITVAKKGLGPRSLHWNIKAAWLMEQVALKKLILNKLHTATQPGDIFTKILDEITFIRHCDFLFRGGCRVYADAKLGDWAQVADVLD